MSDAWPPAGSPALQYVAGDALPCLKAMIVGAADVDGSGVSGSWGPGSSLAPATQSTTGMFLCSLGMHR